MGESFNRVGDLGPDNDLSVRCPACGRSGLVTGKWPSRYRHPTELLGHVFQRARISDCGSLGTHQWSVTDRRR